MTKSPRARPPFQISAGADPLAASADGKLPSDCAQSDAPLAAETLKKVLLKAEEKARKAGARPRPAAMAPAAPAAAPAAASAGEEAAGGAPGAYAQVFARLPAQEQERRVDGFARMAEAEVAGLDFLEKDAKEAIRQVSL